MARFKFRLEKVLEVKEIALKQEQRRLSDINQKRHHLLQTRHQLEGIMEDCMQQINQLENSQVDLLASYHTYLHQIMQDIRQLEQQLFQLDEEEMKIRHKLQEIQKEKKVLENLRDKRYARFLKDQERQEQNTLDELALLGSQAD